ncbi:hypothetical protein RMSM_04024 [Rhodopirellula maiorica SM1]|uniref:Uncharacterized protein n=1 Tax=Rhodopirellula maiorica SM1 TaxID=1265738 RepID=M5RIA8_9BACT|nr:hypothetical protein RMSM_04024 [Rhodopirellula maiorica SM1]
MSQELCGNPAKSEHFWLGLCRFFRLEQAVRVVFALDVLRGKAVNKRQ